MADPSIAARPRPIPKSGSTTIRVSCASPLSSSRAVRLQYTVPPVSSSTQMPFWTVSRTRELNAPSSRMRSSIWAEATSSARITCTVCRKAGRAGRTVSSGVYPNSRR